MYLDRLFKMMAERQASDLFISCGAPLNMKINGVVVPLTDQPMDIDTVRRVAYELMTEEQARTFESDFEMNLSDPRPGGRQLPDQHLPAARHGLAGRPLRPQRHPLVRAAEAAAGPARTGHAKAWAGADRRRYGFGQVDDDRLDDRPPQRTQTGHILTIEDPIEYLFQHKKSIVNQRELGIDTQTLRRRSKNAMRQAPDFIVIGEIRDRETMQHALLPTLDRSSAPLDVARQQQLPRAVADHQHVPLRRAFRPAVRPVDRPARHRLATARAQQGGRLQPAVEILLNSSLIAELVKNGEITQIKEAMEKSLYPGSQTFEQALCRLHLDGLITYEEAMTASDSSTNLAWLINQNAPTARINAPSRSEDSAKPQRLHSDFAELQIEPGMLDRPH